MQELIERIVQKLDLDPATAEKAVGIVLGLVRQNGDKAKVKDMFALLPGADALADAHGGGSGGGGGLFGAFAALAGPMAAMAKLKAAGLSMEQSQVLGQEVLAYAKECCGEPLVKDVAKSIPGLSAYV
ncbi:hypothetical protein FHS85_002108 [Rhodoligotrophos appendicifer]|uniref:DUF2267 domain-containing protein n=1 Tax=Rhodoligotrophos appendicifer TaxID=987056 RepID=UPI0011848D9B|nr:DUF2267 domain-containing protein [Rhodoligotrophos appendicifer]